MSDGRSIEWCDATWQPLVGCTRVSAGCDNCYAISMVHRFRKSDGLTKLRGKDAARPGVDWTGKVQLQPERLADPLRWRKARRVFVCSQADLFHAQVPFEYIAAVFGVMAACPQHTFLVLTKRPERAREFFAEVDRIAKDPDGKRSYVCRRLRDALRPLGHAEHAMLSTSPWPLPNVHLGTSVEDQATADARIPELLACPATLHWVSLEPQLEAVHLHYALEPRERDIDFRDRDISTWKTAPFGAKLGWVVQGGESGPRSRLFDPAWARLTRGECEAAGTPYFFKQWGGKDKGKAGRELDGRTHDEVPT